MLAVALPDLHQLAAEIKNRRGGWGSTSSASRRPMRRSTANTFANGSTRAGTARWSISHGESSSDRSGQLPRGRKIGNLRRDELSRTAGAGDRRDRAHHAKVARYALGDDYHEPIKCGCASWPIGFGTRSPAQDARCGVDTAPVMEREFAARAGVGWVGKNTCVINRDVGSWLLLGEVITTLALPPDRAGDRSLRHLHAAASTPAPPARSPRPISSTRAGASRT